MSAMPTTVKPVQFTNLTNVFQLTDKIYSGSTPDSEEAFKALKDKGIKTIISVEGARPEVEMAKKYGIRYVHLPIGYDGVSTNLANRIIKAAVASDGPVFVHCRIGLQRGPAGAALVCMGTDGWTADQAMAWMRAADTSTNYTGLFRSVADYKPPTKEEIAAMPADFPELTEVTGLAKEMVRIDTHFRELKNFRKAGYQKPASNPELNAAEEARQLHDKLKALLVSSYVKEHNTDFRQRLGQAEEAAVLLQHSLVASPMDTNNVESGYLQLNASCVYCHREHRK
jgi:protein tyrosine phosphatase (PTP) superfamily phosphohydrolase (DUF442 family)